MVGTVSERKGRLGASSVARIAGNILSGFAADHEPTRENADVAFDLAVYIAEKADAWEAERSAPVRIELRVERDDEIADPLERGR